jgi:hypothetical protein
MVKEQSLTSEFAKLLDRVSKMQDELDGLKNNLSLCTSATINTGEKIEKLIDLMTTNQEKHKSAPTPKAKSFKFSIAELKTLFPAIMDRIGEVNARQAASKITKANYNITSPNEAKRSALVTLEAFCNAKSIDISGLSFDLSTYVKGHNAEVTNTSESETSDSESSDASPKKKIPAKKKEVVSTSNETSDSDSSVPVKKTPAKESSAKATPSKGSPAKAPAKAVSSKESSAKAPAKASAKATPSKTPAKASAKTSPSKESASESEQEKAVPKKKAPPPKKKSPDVGEASEKASDAKAKALKKGIEKDNLFNSSSSDSD